MLALNRPSLHNRENNVGVCVCVCVWVGVGVGANQIGTRNTAGVSGY